MGSGQRFLPRVVDRRDWTIRPLSVPEDATAAVAIHQPGSGRIWIGTAPDGGDVGLAYTDDGGSSWTDVELPEAAAPHQRASLASEQTVGCRSHRGQRRRRARDSTRVWINDCLYPQTPVRHGTLSPSIRGETDSCCSSWTNDWSSQRGSTSDSTDLFVSNSASDWSRLERVEDPPNSAYPATAPNSTGDSTLANVESPRSTGPTFEPIFSTDLSDWWSIPSLRDVSGESRSSDGEPSSRSVVGIRQQRPNADASPPRTAPLAHRTRHHRHRPRLQTR